MSLTDYIERGWLSPQRTSKEEIANLLAIVERDYDDSSKELTHDWQFGMAYKAALKLATILVRASGHRVKGHGHHMNTFILIPEFLGPDKKDDSEYLDTCRRKRNLVEYDCVGGASETDVVELREFVHEFKEEVISWLKKNYPDLL